MGKCVVFQTGYCLLRKKISLMYYFYCILNCLEKKVHVVYWANNFSAFCQLAWKRKGRGILAFPVLKFWCHVCCLLINNFRYLHVLLLYTECYLRLYYKHTQTHTNSFYLLFPYTIWSQRGKINKTKTMCIFVIIIMKFLNPKHPEVSLTNLEWSDIIKSKWC